MEDTKEEEEKRGETRVYRLLRWIKIFMPHFVLLCMSLCYLAAGSLILQKLENGADVTQRYERLVRLDQTFRWIINETWEKNKTTYGEWHVYMYDVLLQNVSYMYEKRRLSMENMQVQSEWTYPTAVLYTLTVLTACGYSRIGPLTDAGRLFSVCYAMVGIPLMFLMAADMGKFLSEILMKLCRLFRRWKRAYRWRLCPGRMKQQKATAANHKSLAEETDDPEYIENMLQEFTDSRIPLPAYLVLVCFYCTIGALLFRSYEHDWSFLYAFHFAFNTVVTIGMGNLVVTDTVYLCLVVAYVIVGLVVLTMCIDLAAIDLIRCIHRIGRSRYRFLQMTEDIKEIMALIAAMRKKKGRRVTWTDLKIYVENEDGEEHQPGFEPGNAHSLKYIDETSLTLSTSRRSSANSCLLTAGGCWVPLQQVPLQSQVSEAYSMNQLTPSPHRRLQSPTSQHRPSSE